MTDPTIWLPLYIGDFLADTARFSTEEIGAFLLLKLDYFRNGPLPSDERILRQITRLQGDAWSNAWKTLKPLLVCGNDGKWHNEKWDSEIARITEKRVNAQNKATNAANTRWGHNAQRNAPSIVQALPESCQSQSHSQSQTENTKTKTFSYVAREQDKYKPLGETYGINQKPSKASAKRARNHSAIQKAAKHV